jgi:hypothetical protein
MDSKMMPQVSRERGAIADIKLKIFLVHRLAEDYNGEDSEDCKRDTFLHDL